MRLLNMKVINRFAHIYLSITNFVFGAVVVVLSVSGINFHVEQGWGVGGLSIQLLLLTLGANLMVSVTRSFVKKEYIFFDGLVSIVVAALIIVVIHIGSSDAETYIALHLAAILWAAWAVLNSAIYCLRVKSAGMIIIW